MFEKRSYEEELMDDLSAGGPVIEQTLRELETINRLLGGNYVTTNGLDQLLKSKSPTGPLRIADLGCGGGDMLKLVAKWAKKKGVDCELIGIDANPHIIEYAAKNCKGYDSIDFQVADIFSQEFRKQQFDIVICTLFTHHFDDESLIEMFKQYQSQSKIGVVINDLHRHWLAYYSIKLLTQLFSKSEMVRYDGPLSVRRAFKRRELLSFLQKAGIQPLKLRWMWAFRWQLIY